MANVRCYFASFTVRRWWRIHTLCSERRVRFFRHFCRLFWPSSVINDDENKNFRTRFARIRLFVEQASGVRTLNIFSTFKSACTKVTGSVIWGIELPNKGLSPRVTTPPFLRGHFATTKIGALQFRTANEGTYTMHRKHTKCKKVNSEIKCLLRGPAEHSGCASFK